MGAGLLLLLVLLLRLAGRPGCCTALLLLLLRQCRPALQVMLVPTQQHLQHLLGPLLLSGAVLLLRALLRRCARLPACP
jgi:hypothetical protein